MTDPAQGGNASTRLSAPSPRFATMRERSMLLLLLFLVITVFVVPAFLRNGPAGRVILDVLMTLVLLAGLLAVAEHRRIFPVLAVLSTLSIAVRWSEWIVPYTHLAALNELSTLLALVVLALAVGFNVFGAGTAVANRITGAVVLYILIGVAWALVYEVLSAALPGAFSGAEGNTEYVLERWVYFSFVTLTTVGYGDIAPVARAARSLAIFEALVGQLYPAVILARLVSLPADVKPGAGDSQG